MFQFLVSFTGWNRALHNRRVVSEEGKIKVCVVGAGAAGLCAARHLAANTKFETTVYEQTNEIGGTWVYKEQIGFDENGLPIHSSMYQNLRTNLPAKIMNFPDYITMEAQEPCCVSHQEILKYLRDYAQHFDICRHIQFNTRVEHVRYELAEDCNTEKWSVQVKKLKTNETELRYFDAVMICNGLTSPLPSNMIQVAGIESIHETTFHLRDGTTVDDINFFLFCTGYKYNFPFLNENCGIHIDDNYVTPLYKHLINIEHPSMCIVGIPTIVVPFPMFHMQVQYFLALLEGRVTLPTKSMMLEDSIVKTPKKRHAHKLMDYQWDYNDSLAIAGGFNQLPLFYKLGYKAWSIQRSANLLRYKDSKFVFSEDGQSVQLIIPE
ncbi:uncharacterized protein [Anoplolepis gracilipes]|uniref:uncharacterized protein isoform X4 n=1 Tax=Anoplolepis gracilipes TaxID=354296 RepID=UPI003B9E449C